MNKRQRFYEKVEEAKERYRHVSSDLLQKQLPFMSIKECIVAAKAVLEERDQAQVLADSISVRQCEGEKRKAEADSLRE